MNGLRVGVGVGVVMCVGLWGVLLIVEFLGALWMNAV